MNGRLLSRPASTGFVWGLVLVLAAAGFWLQAPVDLDLADEGFLLYGAWRVGQGEVPVRDFKSYDPGRYYWLALSAWAFGGSLAAYRGAMAAAGAVGLGFGLLAARRVLAQRWSLMLVGLALHIWMRPRYKLFEPALTLVALWVATRLAERPSPRRELAAGLFVGLAAFFGRNHGLYTLIAFVTLAVVLQKGRGWRAQGRALGRLAAGIAAGYSPMLVLALLAPGFATSLVEGLLAAARRGATNISLAFPWPWRANLGGPVMEDLHALGVGLSFVALFTVFPAVAFRLWRRRSAPEAPLLMAVLVVGVPYAHHASVRSDLSHLCQISPPLLIGSVALLVGARAAVGWAGGILLATLTVLVPLHRQPDVVRLFQPDAFVERTVAGRPVHLRPEVARLLEGVDSAIASRLGPDDRPFFAPGLSGLYWVQARRSPVWDIYPMWPADAAAEERMLHELRDPRVSWALIGTAGIDGRPELAFPATHPQVWRMLTTAWAEEPADALGPSYRLFRRPPEERAAAGH